MNLVGKKAPEFTENAVTGDGKFAKNFASGLPRAVGRAVLLPR